MDKDTFVQKLLKTDQYKYEMTEFDYMINQTQQHFYRHDNNFCIAHGPSSNEMFVVMKDNVYKNGCDHVAARLNLGNGTVKKFTRDHDHYILSLLYIFGKDVLVTGGWDQSICLYNCRTMRLIKRVIVGQGEIGSLLMKSNMLFSGSYKIVSAYQFDDMTLTKNMTNNPDLICDINLIKHIEVLPQAEDEIYFTTFTNCGKTEFWLSGGNSNKIHHLSIDQENNSNLISKLNVIISEFYWRTNIKIG